MLYMPTALATSRSAFSTRSSSIVSVWIWSRLIGVVKDLVQQRDQFGLDLVGAVLVAVDFVDQRRDVLGTSAQAVDQAQHRIGTRHHAVGVRGQELEELLALRHQAAEHGGSRVAGW